MGIDKEQLGINAEMSKEFTLSEISKLSNKVDDISIAQKTVNTRGIKDLLDTEQSFTLPLPTTNGTPTVTYVRRNITLTDSIEKYDFLHIQLALKSSVGYYKSMINTVDLSKIVYNNTETRVENDGSTFFIDNAVQTDLAGSFGEYNQVFSAWFKTPTNLFIELAVNPVKIVNFNQVSITSIQGINIENVTIDPVEYINTTQGIEDVPVGNIIDIIGENIPKHYLYCNGAVYNIADYLHLAEYIKKEFGIYNYFGGDGTTTFAVPNLVNGNPLVDITPTMTSNATPSPYVVTGSAPYYADNPAYLAFNNGATTSSFLTVPSGWVQLDFVSNQKVSHFLLQAPNSGDMTIMPKDFTLYGSNDGSSYVELKSYSNQSKWLLNEKRVYDLEDVYNYRYYKFKIINNNGSATYSAINEIRFLLKEVEKVVCIKYEPTYFMNIQGLVETNILWDGNVGTTGTTVVKNSINLNDSILNYDKIGVHFATTDSKGEVRPQYNEITQFEWNKLKTAPNSQTSLSFVWGYGSFADYTTFEITSTDTRLDISQTQSCIYRVDGIRYKTFQTN